MSYLRKSFIDEAQRAPELFLAIKAAVDADRRPGRFLLTGSAGVLAVPKVAESLAGRMELHTLWPFSQGEAGGLRETFVDRLFGDSLDMPAVAPEAEDSLLERICVGGFPEVRSRTRRSRRRAWFDAYIDSMLQRDVRDLANIERLVDLPRLLSLLAFRAGQPVNFADLARTLAIPQSTLKRYVDLLKLIFLVVPLPAWYTNLTKRVAKAPKLMLGDTGLLTHLLDADPSRLKSDRALLGHVFENFVAMEVTKQLGWAERRCQLFHFRTETGAECDLVIEDRAGRLVGVEVKCATTVRRGDFRGIEKLAETAGDRFLRGVVLHPGTEVVPFGKRLHAVPVGQLWH